MSLGNGVCMPLFAIIFGNLTNSFTPNNTG